MRTVSKSLLLSPPVQVNVFQASLLRTSVKANTIGADTDF